jgi:cobalamin biosynthesis Mg chelatase CobN
MAFRNILGFIPTYLRPPYSECAGSCSSYLSTLGYHATYFDLDTADYLNDSPELIQNSKDIFVQELALYGSVPSTSNFLGIAHDNHFQTVYNLTEFMLKTMAAKGYGTSVTVGTCLGDPVQNWYRSAGNPIVTCSYTASTKSTSTSSYRSSSTKAPTTSATQQSSSTIRSSSTASATSATQNGSSSGTGTSTSSKPSSTSSLSISVDGTCGTTTTCQGSVFGNCCSQYGYCGSASGYCGTGCQSGFGTCGISS